MTIKEKKNNQSKKWSKRRKNRIRPKKKYKNKKKTNGSIRWAEEMIDNERIGKFK
jgi:hypothetical protein